MYLWFIMKIFLDSFYQINIRIYKHDFHLKSRMLFLSNWWPVLKIFHLSTVVCCLSLGMLNWLLVFSIWASSLFFFFLVIIKAIRSLDPLLNHQTYLPQVNGTLFTSKSFQFLFKSLKPCVWPNNKLKSLKTTSLNHRILSLL